MRDPEWTWRGALYGRVYRTAQRVMHRYGWHHTRRIGPLEPDGVTLHRCDWCGVSRTDTPLHVIERRMREHGTTEKNLR